MSEAWTPGPWRVRVNKRDSHDECDLSICGDIFVLADLTGPQYPHQHPNAHLIAAAPDLYAALEAFQMFYPMGINPDLDDAYRSARAALAKARNSTQPTGETK